MNDLQDIRQRFRELRATAMASAGANYVLDKDLYTLAEKTEAYCASSRSMALSLRLEDEVENLCALSADLEDYQAAVEDALIASGRVLEAIERFDKLKL